MRREWGLVALALLRLAGGLGRWGVPRRPVEVAAWVARTLTSADGQAVAVLLGITATHAKEGDV